MSFPAEILFEHRITEYSNSMSLNELSHFKLIIDLITGRVQSIVRGFNNDWKRALELINGDVMRAFTNFKNGTQILQVFIIASFLLEILMII